MDESLGGFWFWSIPAGGSTPATDIAKREIKINKTNQKKNENKKRK